MLESYITPLLMGYVNKYIKNLKPSDLSLSVWGGDVVLQNLELHLDVLQKELNLPVTFLSGRIHELRIHVPWTRITYEPVAITINTIEFIVKLREPDERTNDEDEEANEENKKQMKKELQKAKVQREAEHLPPGYVQGVLNKVINNVSVCVNNLILKYVEDDIVFSLNVKSASLFSVNEQWEKSFIELSLPNLCLRKVCDINDLTVCLDSRNADGKIEMYQDPLLYKCNLSCRMLSKYQGIGSMTAYENHVNVYCESLDMSATDLQLPMLARLLKLCVGLYYRTLDLPGCSDKVHPAREMLEERLQRENAKSSANKSRDESLDDLGWASWAWSKIPYLTDDGNETGDLVSRFPQEAVLVFGIYVTQCSLTLKVIDEASNNSIVGSRRFEFSPVLNIEMSGCAVEILAKGEVYFDCQLGVSNIVGYLIGDCLCKKSRKTSKDMADTSMLSIEDELSRDDEDELFFRIGTPTETPEDGVGFLKGSLFSQSEDSLEYLHEPATLPNKGTQFVEAEVMKKFGACFVDYFYTMELPADGSLESEGKGPNILSNKDTELIKETSTKRAIIGKCQTFITSKLFHLITKIIEFSSDGVPSKKVKDKPYIDPFVIEQLKNGNLPTRSLHFTCHSASFNICFADHVFGRNTNALESLKENTEHNSLYGMLIQVDRVDYQVSSPMFPVELNALMQSDSKSIAVLYRASFCDYYLKAFGIQIGLCEYLSDYLEPTVLNIVPPVHASIYSKICISQWIGKERFKIELRAETPSINIGLTKAQLLLLIKLYESWTTKIPAMINEFLISDVFHPKANADGVSSVLEIALIGLQGKYMQNDSLHAVSGSVGSIKVAVQSLRNDSAMSTAIMYGPLNTARMSDIEVYLNANDDEVRELPNGTVLSFKAHIPKDDMASTKVPAIALFELKGIAVNIDPMLLSWIDYMPALSTGGRVKYFHRKTSKLLSRTLSSSTPKKTSYSRVFGTSQISKERNKVGKVMKNDEGESDKKKSCDNQLAYFMKILESLIIKAQLDSIAIILPTKTFVNDQVGSIPSFNIPYMLRTYFRNSPEKFPDCVIVTLPQLKLCSSNVKDLESWTDIPMMIDRSRTTENSLPWSLNGEGFTVYTLTSQLPSSIPIEERFYIWKPATWTVFLAAAHANPALSKDSRSSFSSLQESLSAVGVKPVINQMSSASRDHEKDFASSLGFCVHIDLASVLLSISKHQAAIVLGVLSRLLTTLDRIKAESKIKNPSKKMTDFLGETELSKRSVLRDDETRSLSTASTAEPLDDLTASTGASLSSSPLSNKPSEDFAISLWLQWIIPKMSITFYSDQSLRSTIYKIPIEFDDLSFAFDYQKGKVEMTSKVASVAVKNFVFRSEAKDWETEGFEGILLSCEDVLARDIELLPSSKKLSSRSFFSMTYSRVLLSDVHSRSRYTSIRSEAAIAMEEHENDDVTQSHVSPKYSIDENGLCHHKISLCVQSFDVIGVFDPLLHIANSFLDLNMNLFSRQEKKAAAILRQPELQQIPREGSFQPLPIVSIEGQGFRFLIPVKNTSTATTDENVIIFCLGSLLLSADPENRISSTVFNKEWYRCLRKHQREKSRRTKTWHVQYQIDVTGMSLWTGRWTDVCRNDVSSDGQLSLLAEKQNPALEWNYEWPRQKDPLKLTPVLSDFSFSAVVSPSLSVSSKKYNANLKLTASSLEVNFPKELQIYLNPYQLNLMADTVGALLKSFEDCEPRDLCSESDSRCQHLKSPDNIDSGVASVLSAKISELSKDKAKSKLQQSVATSSEVFQFEVLITAKNITGSLYLKRSNEDGINQKSILRPIAHCQISQPSVNISWFKEKSLEIALHDFLFSAAASDVYSDGVVPDHSLYGNILVKTENGKPNPKTGLFPSALSLKLNGNKAFQMNIEIGRPGEITLYLEVLESLALFSNEINHVAQNTSTEVTEEGSRDNRGIEFFFNELAFKTTRLSFKVSKTVNNAGGSLITRLRSIQGSVDMENKNQGIDGARLKCNVEGMEVLVRQTDEECCLLSPCIFDIDGQVDYIRHISNNDCERFLPKLNISITSGLVRLRFGQQHYKYLTALIDEMIVSREEKTECHALESNKCGQNNLETLEPCEVQYSHDDLRTNLFQYVMQGGKDGSHPSPNEIIFSEEADEKPPTMTWRYSQPRFLTDLAIIPLPFHLDETALLEEELSRIPCVIRYWDNVEQNFVTYRNFFLSQTESCTLVFPDPTENAAESGAVAAEEWQVVVDVAIESENAEISDDEEIPEDILRRVTSVYKTPVSAMSLAACMKINSCCIPSMIPFLFTSASIGCLQVTLLNHFEAAEHEQSRLFAPFFLDSFTYLLEQESCLVEISDFSCKTSHLGGRNPRHNLTLELDLGVDVMSYDNLSWRKCLSVSSLAADMSLETDPTKHGPQSLSAEKSKISIDVDKLDIYVSQNIVHTLTMTVDHWLNFQNKETCFPLLNHYIVCNETEDVIRFGQVGTDEDLVLASGQMYPYSWRSPHDQAMHLCNDSIGDWKWTSPFNIDTAEGCVRTIQHNTHQSILHIEVGHQMGVQKQIIIKGGIVFRNCLAQDIEFEVILHHTELVGPLQQQKMSQVVKHFLVPSKTARPSVLCSPETITAVYVRFSGSSGSQGWTIALPLLQNETQDFSMPLSLQDGDYVKNCWYSVSRIINTRYTQLQVCICPFFIVRNHLCWPVTMTANSRDKRKSITCYSHGKGKETEIYHLDSCTWYNVTFQLEGTNECTDPPLAVNTTFIELLTKKNRLDAQQYTYDNEWPYTDGCAISEEEPPKIISPSSSLESSADLKCQLLQKWMHLPTIVIEIRPKFIIHNSSSTNLVLRDPEMHLTWELLSGTTVTSPAIQNAVQFGIQSYDSENILWSSEVRIVEHIKVQDINEGKSKNFEELSPHSSISFSITDVENNCCYQLAVTSKKRDGIIILNISERFCIHNSTGIQLKCFPTLCSTKSEKAELGNFFHIPDSEDTFFLSQITIRQSPDERENYLDLSSLELKFYFYSIVASPVALEDAHTFNLSRDHLRENVTLKQQDGDCMLLVVTSCFKDGVVNVFLDQETCPCFTFVNHTAHDLLIKSQIDCEGSPLKQKIAKTAELHVELVDVYAGRTVHFQPKNFNRTFPRTENKRDGYFQIAALPDSEIFSDTVHIRGEIKDRFMDLGSCRIALSCQIASNSFHIFFTDGGSIQSVKHSISLPTINMSLCNTSVILIDHESCQEVLSATASESYIHHDIIQVESGFENDSESLVLLKIGTLQIDNQIANDCDHFPVVLLPLREVSLRYRGEVSQNFPLADVHASTKSSFLEVKASLYAKAGQTFFNRLNMKIEPIEVYMEDSFLYQIARIIDSFSPPRVARHTTKNEASLVKLRKIANQVLCPINIGKIEVSDIKILLSIHASVKMYLATDHMPVVLGKLSCDPAITTSRELSRRIMYHYATQALVRAGLMLGSLEILANPTGLIRSIGQGIFDFVMLPYDGLTRGPSAFVSGITRGMGSFVRHTSVGALTSITNFASSVSRNMDRLSLDEQHIIWQEEHRRRALSQTFPGFGGALGSLGVSLLGAIAGVAEHPITNIQNASDTKEAIKGAVTGFGKGLVGMVTKPIGGAMELVSQTGQGILLGTGLVIPPEKVRSNASREEIKRMEVESYMKYCWKVIRLDFERFSDLLIIQNVYVTSVADKQGYKGAIISTSSALYLYDYDVNNIRKAFSCNEINLRLCKDGPHAIFIDQVEKISHEGYGLCKAADCEYLNDTHDVKGKFSSNRCFPFCLQMDPRFASLLLSQFAFQKNMAEEKLADELEVFSIGIF